MGLTHVTTRVQPVTPSKRHFEAEFLVDTGALDCLAPASALKRIGIRPEGKDVYELANGEPVEYPYGFARVAFMGSETVTRIRAGRRRHNRRPLRRRTRTRPSAWRT